MTNRKIEYRVIPPESDAEFAPCMEGILDVDARPYDPDCPVLCMDEQPVQRPKETRTPIPATKQHGRRVDSQYERAGTADIFLFAEPLAGWREVGVRTTKTKVDWAVETARLLEGRYAFCRKVILVCDNLDTHTPGAFCEAFPPERARELVRRLEFHHTPKHGSRLNVAENELGSLTRQCVSGRRFGDVATLARETSAWSTDDIATRRGVDRHMKIVIARCELKSVSPEIQMRRSTGPSSLAPVRRPVRHSLFAPMRVATVGRGPVGTGGCRRGEAGQGIRSPDAWTGRIVSPERAGCMTIGRRNGPPRARRRDGAFAAADGTRDLEPGSGARARSTTILTVRRDGIVAVGGDGQVSYGQTILKADTKKIRWILDRKVLVGFAGSTADAFTLVERFEAKAKDHPGNIVRAATELARDWRTDRMLRRLEAMMVVVDREFSLLLTGQGDVVQPTDGIIGIGSGGQYAIAAARALVARTTLGATEIVRESLRIAAEIDVYTNDRIVVEELACSN